MDDIITLDYGSGGQKTAELIASVFVRAFDTAPLTALGDAAHVPGASSLAMTTDSFVVDPLFFPGGDIGRLAICGTVNDLLVSGALPQYLSFSCIIEEGLPLAVLQRVAASAAQEACACHVSVVTGDTKVVPRGHGDGLYLNTSGVGFCIRNDLCAARIQAGDVVLVSGDVGRHAMAVMLARHDLGLDGTLSSDCAPLTEAAQALMAFEGLRIMRDPTRGGLAGVLCEFVQGLPLGMELFARDIPVHESVSAACDMLGIDPLYCACEGRLVAVISPQEAECALERLRALPNGEHAAIIGTITAQYPGRVVLRTTLGAGRILMPLAGAQLPRIC